MLQGNGGSGKVVVQQNGHVQTVPFRENAPDLVAQKLAVSVQVTARTGGRIPGYVEIPLVIVFAVQVQHLRPGLHHAPDVLRDGGAAQL